MSPVPSPPRRTVVVLGGTGLVGGHLVRALAADPGVGHVRAPLRRLTPAFPGLAVETPVLDFRRVSEAGGILACDQLFVCLGTTLRQAGSRQAFRSVDFDAVVDAASAAVTAGAQAIFMVSSVGADASSRSFYLRVKGEVEQALAALPVPSLHIFRPSILTGARAESRPGERLGILVTTLASPFLRRGLRRYRPIAAEAVARAMARVASGPEPGRHVHESEAIAALGR